MHKNCCLVRKKRLWATHWTITEAALLTVPANNVRGNPLRSYKLCGAGIVAAHFPLLTKSCRKIGDRDSHHGDLQDLSDSS